jgi:hypothetical protein
MTFSPTAYTEETEDERSGGGFSLDSIFKIFETGTKVIDSVNDISANKSRREELELIKAQQKRTGTGTAEVDIDPATGRVRVSADNRTFMQKNGLWIGLGAGVLALGTIALVVAKGNKE